MNLPQSMTTVTPLSKVLAAILFIVLPFAGFFAGSFYGQNSKTPTPETKTVYITNTPIATTAPVATTTILPTTTTTKTYTDNNFGITFQYSSNLYAGTYNFGVDQAGVNTFPCTNEFIKNKTKCGTTFRSPIVAVSTQAVQTGDASLSSIPTRAKNQLSFYGPVPSLGIGNPGCNDTCTETSQSVTIVGKSFTLLVDKYTGSANNISYHALLKDDATVPASSTSMFSKFNVAIDTDTKETMDALIKVLNTVKYN